MKPSTFEFSKLYPNETMSAPGTPGIDKENFRSSNVRLPSSKKKNKQKSNERSGLVGSDSSKATSTPLTSKKNHKLMTPTGVDSIQKVTSSKKSRNSILRKSASDQENDSSTVLGLDKPKKRNKSVSFMLEDGEASGKKTKTTEIANVSGENILSIAEPAERKTHKHKNKKNNAETGAKLKEKNFAFEENENKLQRKKNKKAHDPANTVSAEELIIFKEDNNEEAYIKPQKNKLKMKKTHKVTKDQTEVLEMVEITKKKQHKRQKLAESIAENLESLTIGDNASTIASLLDEMKVVDRHKKQKKFKLKEQKSQSIDNLPDNGDEKTFENIEGSTEINENTQSTDKTYKRKKAKGHKRKRKLSEAEDGEAAGAEAGAERVKWHKRKWNKERKPQSAEEEIEKTVIVENLPLSTLLTYRKVLSEHFSKYGPIKKIGIAECYPTEESRPVFTTTVQFQSDEAATQALEEDNTQLAGARVRVKRPLPPTQTTLAVRCYRGCSQQSMSSIFTPCGRVRSIREIVKGPNTMPTAFVEFDGPEAAEKGLKAAAEARIGGKKVVASRFEHRIKGLKWKRKSSETADVVKESEKENSS